MTRRVNGSMAKRLIFRIFLILVAVTLTVGIIVGLNDRKSIGDLIFRIGSPVLLPLATWIVHKTNVTEQSLSKMSLKQSEYLNNFLSDNLAYLQNQRDIYFEKSTIENIRLDFKDAIGALPDDLCRGDDTYNLNKRARSNESRIYFVDFQACLESIAPLYLGGVIAFPPPPSREFKAAINYTITWYWSWS